MRDALTLAFTMVGGGMAAILLLMLVAKLTGKVNVEEKQGRKPVYNIQAMVKGKRTLVEADPENPTILMIYNIFFDSQRFIIFK